MQSIQPQNLTNAELLRYAYMQGHDKLPVDWITEIIKRFETLLDDNK
jgi:hypothetical protein